MSEPKTSAATECSWDAHFLTEVSVLLQDSACLHHALTELITDADKKAAAAQSSALFSALGALLHAHSAKLGVFPCIRDVECAMPAHRERAIDALVHADQTNAFRHIALCDAVAVARIEQLCGMIGIAPETQNLLLTVHRALQQSSIGPSAANGSVHGSS